MPTLKVYRTPIGFHDAYVAAPSKKAALRAWGSAKDLFARGAAELVTDPALMAAPLAEPGVVIKRSRGTAAEQIAALPPDPPRRAVAAEVEEAPARRKAKAAPKPAPKPKPKPRPDRSALDDADAAIGATAKRHDKARQEIDARIAALQTEREALVREQREEQSALENERDQLADTYDAAMREWRG
ncbi:hypothetical protein [Sphingomonas sp. PB4P5]|uniref:hypothetical protein n=1 Tax=Parasphingomonas puruogangriensis TaxID=3096155 RepID=UPI002FC7C899